MTPRFTTAGLLSLSLGCSSGQGSSPGDVKCHAVGSGSEQSPSPADTASPADTEDPDDSAAEHADSGHADSGHTDLEHAVEPAYFVRPCPEDAVVHATGGHPDDRFEFSDEDVVVPSGTELTVHRYLDKTPHPWPTDTQHLFRGSGPLDEADNFVNSVPGDYRVRLVPEDAEGRVGPAWDCPIDLVPGYDLWVDVVTPPSRSVNLHLHLRRDGAPLYSVPGDVNDRCNKDEDGGDPDSNRDDYKAWGSWAQRLWRDQSKTSVTTATSSS